VRFKAMKALSDRGIYCNLLIMPVLPGITDSEDNLTEVLIQAKAAGAKSATAAKTPAKPAVKKVAPVKKAAAKKTS